VRVAAQVKHIDPGKILPEVLSKSIEGYALQKTVVRHEANDAVSSM